MQHCCLLYGRLEPLVELRHVMCPFIGTLTNHVPEIYIIASVAAASEDCSCILLWLWGLRWAVDCYRHNELIAVWKCGGLIVLGAQIVSMYLSRLFHSLIPEHL